MAKLERTLNQNFSTVLHKIEEGILNGSISASLEASSDFKDGDARCSVRVFERYSYMGGNRLSIASAMTAIPSMMQKKIDQPLKYVECAVTMAEVPREISLTLSISNCIYRCHNFHSQYLQQDTGRPLQHDLDALIRRYSGLITCVCLMGEGRNMEQLEYALMMIRARGLKTCL